MHLRSISLQNFRCFRSGNFELSKITLLAGPNSGGKSTVINALLTAIQGPRWESYPFTLTLNGDLCSMGGFNDTVFRRSEELPIAIGLSIGHGPYADDAKATWKIYARFSYVRRHQRIIPIEITAEGKYGSLSANRNQDGTYAVKFSAPADEGTHWDKLLTELGEVIQRSISDQVSRKELELAQKHFGQLKFSKALERDDVKSLSKGYEARAAFPYEQHYIMFILQLEEIVQGVKNWVRYLGPARVYPERFYFDKTPAIMQMGTRGEQITGVLFHWQASHRRKLQMVQRYLSELELASMVKPKQLKSNVLQLLVKVSSGMPEVSLQDVGFGVSQALPLVVHDVDLGKDGTLIMSQPELHLHPSSQATIADYMVKRCSELNRQYIVETHSEYLLNRFRVLIAKGALREEDLVVYYLSIHDGEAHPQKITVRRDGSLVGAPKEFFDTYRMDTFRLAMSV